ncbi:vacuolar protein sorting-associated protein VTA1, putative [Plasmodium ovale curtisi]|uniref:Vacuolar protein sorting-associated protein VTA1, putative n=1 Tax=Plasmodium ovale curtisi TaxID=864141 RepID=A0A1A8VIT9_PLAOA|nr:vacuolar protein sorting-associated protein VTA1, putative [Plasmodium ovale curtisi]
MCDLEGKLPERKKINMKAIHFILKKADELEKDHLLVSFLCILYLAEQLNEQVKNNCADVEAKNMLMRCLERAEKIRKSFDSPDYDKFAQFCKRLFLAADKNDRTGEITKRTLQMFFTSQIFYEILNHFKVLDSDEKKKYMYAKYKTIYIKKCFDNNVKPEPGTPRDNNGEFSLSGSDEETQLMGKQSSVQLPTRADKNEGYAEKSHHDHCHSDTREHELGRQISHTRCKTSKSENTVDFTQSLKHAQYAVNALIFEDLDTAKSELRLAISHLEG